MLSTLIFAAAIIWGGSSLAIFTLFAQDEYSRRSGNK
jgi:hypothetical protein